MTTYSERTSGIESPRSSSETLSLDKTVSVELPFETAKTTRIDLHRQIVKTPLHFFMEVESIPSEDPDLAPTVLLKKKNANTSDIDVEEYELVVKDRDIVDVCGYPMMMVMDYDKKKCFLVSLSTNLLRDDLRDDYLEIQKEQSKRPSATVRNLDAVFRTSPLKPRTSSFSMSSYSTDYEHISEALKTLPPFRSLDVAHRTLVNVLIESLQEANVSEQIITQLQNDQEALWNAHLNLSNTLHGQLYMYGVDEDVLWREVLDYNPIKKEGETFVTGDAILDATQEYKRKQIERLVQQDWLIAKQQPPYDKNPVTGLSEIRVSRLDDATESFSVVNDEDDSGIQIAAQREREVGFSRLFIGGERVKKHPGFSHIVVLQEEDGLYTDVTNDEYALGCQQFDISEDAEWNVLRTSRFEHGSTAHVFYLTDQGVKCYSIRFELSDDYEQIESIVRVEEKDVNLEHFFEAIQQAKEKGGKENQSYAEVTAAIEARTIVLKRIEKIKRENQEKKKRGEKPIPYPDYWDVYKKHYKMVEAFFPKYNVFAEGGVSSTVLDTLLGSDVRKRIGDLLHKKNPPYREMPESYIRRYSHGLDGKIEGLTPDEEQELSDLKKEWERTLYCLHLLVNEKFTFPSTGVSDDNLLLLTPPQESDMTVNDSAYKKQIADKLLAISSHETEDEQLAEIRSLIGGPPWRYLRYRDVWKKIVNTLQEIRAEAVGGKDKKKTLLKGVRNSHNDNDFQDEELPEHLLNTMADVLANELEERKNLQQAFDNLGIKELDPLDQSIGLDELRKVLLDEEERSKRLSG